MWCVRGGWRREGGVIGGGLGDEVWRMGSCWSGRRGGVEMDELFEVLEAALEGVQMGLNGRLGGCEVGENGVEKCVVGGEGGEQVGYVCGHVLEWIGGGERSERGEVRMNCVGEEGSAIYGENAARAGKVEI